MYRSNDGKLMIGHGKKRVLKRKETREEKDLRLEREF
jgi:hypothetical protein